MRRAAPRVADAATYALALLLAAAFLMPLLWLVSLAIRTPAEVFLGAARFIPEAPTLENFRQILTDRTFGLYLWNGIKLCALGALGALIVATPAAYVFSRRRFRGAAPLLIGILTVQMVSPLVLLIPLYRYMDRMGMLETHAAAIGVYMALGIPLAVWLLKSSFDAIPRDLEDAAAIDGAGSFAQFRHVTLPMVSAVIFFNLIAYMQEAQPVSLAIAGGLLLSMLLTSPTQGSVERFLRDELKTIEHERELER